MQDVAMARQKPSLTDDPPEADLSRGVKMDYLNMSFHEMDPHFICSSDSGSGSAAPLVQWPVASPNSAISRPPGVGCSDSPLAPDNMLHSNLDTVATTKLFLDAESVSDKELGVDISNTQCLPPKAAHVSQRVWISSVMRKILSSLSLQSDLEDQKDAPTAPPGPFRAPPPQGAHPHAGAPVRVAKGPLGEAGGAEFGVIGAVVSNNRAGSLCVTRMLPDSSASEQVKLTRGDIITSVDHTKIADHTAPADTRKLIIGMPGSTVRLGMLDLTKLKTQQYYEVVLDRKNMPADTTTI